MLEKFVRWIIKNYLPGFTLSKIGKRKSKLVWKESTLEDARDMAIEIAKTRRQEE